MKYTGLIYDLILFCKKTLDDLKRSTLHTPISLRLRLKHGVEIIIIQGKKISKVNFKNNN